MYSIRNIQSKTRNQPRWKNNLKQKINTYHEMFRASLSISTLYLCTGILGQWNPHMLENRNTIIHMFEWKFADIANECENFLQYTSYGAVQIPPITENVIITNPWRPWWERFQPVSYMIKTRSGGEDEFIDMVTKCNAVGIRVYVDIILNHMTGQFGEATGFAGTWADTEAKYFPAIPYHKEHFNPPCNLNDWNNAWESRQCMLVGLLDLNQAIEHVRNKMVEFINKLIHLGVAGFRIDAAKHMWPEDLQVILNRVDDLNTSYGFPPDTRPFIFQEVPIFTDVDSISWKEYSGLGLVTEFKYCAEIGRVFSGNDKLAWLQNWGTNWNFMDSDYALVFVDNHDTQRNRINIFTINYKQPKQYKMATAFMMAHPYGSTIIMSSFVFDDADQGPPADNEGNIISPEINSDDSCSSGWVCEHRWRQIYNMVGFRNSVKETSIRNWWSNGDQQIAFCRGNHGFIAFTNGGTIRQVMQTCLPCGTYCDIISGNLVNGVCTGKAVHVDIDGNASIFLDENEEDGVLAIHVNAMIPYNTSYLLMTM